jgi:hypothetical protein
MPERESDYYLSIRIYNSNRDKPVFNWSQSKGNIAIGIAIAKEEVERKISPERESHYSASIKLHNDKDNRTVFERQLQQGNVRQSLDSLDEFVHVKLGFDLLKQVKDAKAS